MVSKTVKVNYVSSTDDFFAVITRSVHRTFALIKGVRPRGPGNDLF